MGAVEEVRQVIQDFLAPELREIRAKLDAMEGAQDVRNKAIDTRLAAIEGMSRVHYEAIVQRLEQIQQSFAFDKRISKLEDDKMRSA